MDILNILLDILLKPPQPLMADQVKNKTFIKSNLENQIDPKTKILQNFLPKDINETDNVMG